MALGLGSSLVKGGASLLTYVKDNLKLYLDFKSNKSDTLKFPSEGSTSFDGSNDYISAGQSSNLGTGTNFTISLWIKNEGTAKSYITQIQKGVGSSGLAILANSLGTGANAGYVTALAWNGSTHLYLSFDGSIDDGNWHHIAFTTTSSAQVLYFDGQSVDTDTIAFTNAFDSNPIVIGARGNASEFFTGKMANMAIWSRVLEPEEIQSIMNKSYSQLKGVEKTSLVAWWALDDVQKVTDNSVSSGLIESETGEILSSDVKSFDSITGLGNNYTNNILEYVKNGYAFFNISGLAQGKLYRFTYTVLTQTGSGLAHSGGSSVFTGGIPTTVGSHEQYLVAGSQNLLIMRSTGFRGTITDIVLQEVSMTGVVTGATTTTSVYGGNAPILPRAVDVAKEGQADAIGNGSASFNGSSDYVEIGNNPTAPLSISFWFNSSSSATSNQAMFSTTGALEIWIGYNTAGFLRAHFGGSSYIQTPSGIITQNRWYHVTVTLNGTTGKIYINGVNQTLTTSGTLSAPDVSVANIGRRVDTNGNLFVGSISQVGIWQGALTQAQIQSVMESTSYSKIPADVKSTLGSELVSEPSFASNTGWATEYFGTGWSITGNKLVSDGSQSAGSNASALITTSAGLYKVVITVDSISSGTIRPNLESWGSYISTTGTHTQYFTLTGNNHLTIQASADFVGSISFASVKEVTNDIVAYYPLDAVQPSDFATKYLPDATGGVLGAELFTGWENNSIVNQGYYKGWSSFTTSGQTVTASQADEGGAYSKVFNTNAFSVVEGTAYEINITIDSRTNTYIRGLSTSTNSESNFVVYNSIWQNTAIGDAKYVLLANATSSSVRLHIRQQPSRNTSSITISAISIKPLSGNYGRLL